MPLLTEALHDSNLGWRPGSKVFVRESSARTLAEIGPAAIAAVPALRAAVAQKTDSYLRVECAIALWKIRNDLNETLPVLLEEFDGYAPVMQWKLIEAFREMGPKAAAAVPLLVSYIGKDSSGMGSDDHRPAAIVALRSIAPEAAEKIAPMPASKPR